jgi:hypothetical protein
MIFSPRVMQLLRPTPYVSLFHFFHENTPSEIYDTWHHAVQKEPENIWLDTTDRPLVYGARTTRF